MEQLNPSFTHLDPLLISPALSIDDNANAPSTKEVGFRTINLCFPNGLYDCSFSRCGSIYTAIPSLTHHKGDWSYNSKNQVQEEDFNIPYELKCKIYKIKDHIDYKTALQSIFGQ